MIRKSNFIIITKNHYIDNICFIFDKIDVSIYSIDKFLANFNKSSSSYILLFNSINFPIQSIHETINAIHSLQKTNQSFFLSDDKQILLTNDYSLIQNISSIDLPINTLFQPNPSLLENKLKFEEFMYRIMFFKDYRTLYKLPYQYILNLFKQIYSKQSYIHHVFFIDDLSSLFDHLKTFHFKKGFSKITFVIDHKDIANSIKTIYYKTKLYAKRGLAINILPYKNPTLFSKQLINNALWFEQLHFFKNNSLQFKISTKHFSCLPLANSSENTISFNSFIHNLKQLHHNVFVKHYIDLHEESIINNLMNIKDYQSALKFIDRKYKKNMDTRKIMSYITRKISLHFVLNDTDNLDYEIRLITLNVNDIPSLLLIHELLETSKKEQHVEYIRYKIIKQCYDDIKQINNKTIAVYQKLIAHSSVSQSTLELIIDFTKLIIEKNIISVNDNIKIGLFKSIYRLIGKYIDQNELLDKLTSIIDINIKQVKELISNTDKLNNCPELAYYLACSYPAFHSDNQLMLQKRNEVAENLEILLETFPANKYLLDFMAGMPVLNFYLSYNGLPSRDYFIQKSEFFRRICPELNYVKTDFKPNFRKKIAFISSYLNRQHSVFKDRHQVIKHLASLPDFDVHFITFDPLKDEVKYQFGKAKHHIFPKELSKCKQLLDSMNLDILVYCEIGMFPYTYYLAHMKLARVQINTWGHSDTAGINTIDYFISSKYFEEPQAQSHYSEKLVLLDSLSTCYVSPISRHDPTKFKNRLQLGFSNNYTIYWCMQSLFKLSPEFIDIIKRIMTQDKTAILLLIQGGDLPKIMNNFDTYEFANRIHVLPGMQHFEYMNIMNISDIILDPYPFGGCNSSFEAFSLNKPVITMPSAMLNGRFTKGFYQKMDIHDCIVNSADEYVELALKLSQDKNYYKTIQTAIDENKNKIFMEKESLTTWTDFCRNL